MNTAELRQEFSTLQQNAETLINKAADEKRDFTAEEQTESDKHFSRMTEIKSVLDRNNKLASLAFSEAQQKKEATEAVEITINPPGAEITPQEQHEFKIYDRLNKANFSEALKDRNTRKEFAKFFTNWGRGVLDKSNKFATITTATDSGLLLPVDVEQPIVATYLNPFREALKVWGLDPMQTPTTRQINIPVADANAGGVVSETASSETENEPTLTNSINLKIKTYESGSTWFSNQELLAVDFDLFSELLPALNFSKEIGAETDWITTIKGDGNITGQNINTATDSGLTYANLVSLNRTLPKRYNAAKVIMLSKTAYTAAENLTTTTGYPILNMDAQNDKFRNFNGTPVVWSEKLDDFAGTSGKVVGMIFSLINFRVRDAVGQQVQRYTQYPPRAGQTGYNLYGYHCIGYTPPAIALLETP